MVKKISGPTNLFFIANIDGTASTEKCQAQLDRLAREFINRYEPSGARPPDS